MTVKAPAPSRSSFKLTVTLGLVSFQFAAFKLTDARRVVRKQFAPSGNPIKLARIDSGTGEEVAFPEIVMKYETEDGVLVELNDAEITKAGGFDEVTGTEVIGVLPEKYLRGRFFSEEVYAIRPADKHNVRVLAVILEGLARDGQALLFRFVSRGRERMAMLIPNGTMHVFLFEDEIREEPKPSTPVKTTPEEIELASQLFSAYAIEPADLPAQVSTMVPKVEAYAKAKAAGLPKEADPEIPPVPVGDLMAMLAASVEKAKAKV